METYLNLAGKECVIWTDEDGTMHSMTKEAYDALEAQREQSGTL